SNLNERYEEWIDKYDSSKLLTIQVDKVNFADNQEEFGFVINQVEAEINSLFDQEQEELFG
ncbi:MAG: deoxynucleoside kinase, partial [Bacteroidia bacterium]|nr:deoxynucleoside kinase [Bacteroidia bacterium]